MSSIYSIANLKKSFTFYVVLGFVNKNCVGLVKKIMLLQPTSPIIKIEVLKKRSAGIKMLKKPCQPIKNYFLLIDFYVYLILFVEFFYVFLILFEKIYVMCIVHFLKYRII